MQVGDLVMWLGEDQGQGSLGIIFEASVVEFGSSSYAVLWFDGSRGYHLAEKELKKLSLSA